jgi:hypothetical protein
VTVPEGYYDQSYPPSLWAPPPPEVPLTAAAAGGQLEEAQQTGTGDASRAAAGSPVPDAGRTDTVQLPAAGRHAAPAGTGGAASPALTVTAGEPGTYSPAVSAAERPRNLTELRERATAADVAPWPAGAYVLVGESGKRAHWTGEEWRGGDSPGYPGASGRRSTMGGESLPGVPGNRQQSMGSTQFPGDGDDSAQDLTR